MGGRVVREQRKSPAWVAGEVVLLGGRGDGFDDAGDEALGQGGGLLEGAAGVGADVLVGGEGDHEEEDALGGVAGSDGDGGGGGVVGWCFLVFIVFFCFGLFALSPKERGDAGRRGEVAFRRGPHFVPPPKPRDEGRR